jgi:hypothetical protein
VADKIDICFMARKAEVQGFYNLFNLFEVSRLPGVRLLIGFGECESGLLREVEDRKKFFDPVGDSIFIRILHSPRERFDWFLSGGSIWTLMVTDDDFFTTNHVWSLIGSLDRAQEGVVNIIPHFYFLSGSNQIRVHQPKGITLNNPIERVHLLMKEKFTGLRYYSLIKTSVFRELLNRFSSDSVLPSYFDQLLAVLVAMRGQSLRASSQSSVFYDMTNWEDTRSGIESDLKSYSKPLSVLFHESYMLRDFYRLLNDQQVSAEFIEFFKGFCLQMLSRQQNLIGLRRSVTQARGVESTASCEVVTTKVHQVVCESSTWKEIELALDFNSGRDLSIDPYFLS